MELSRQEVNLRRLLAKCELMIKKNQKDDERIPKYLKSLGDMLKEVKQIGCVQQNVVDYLRRIRNIEIGLLGKVQSTFEDDFKIKTNDLNAREELLGLRQRTGSKSATTENIDELISYHQETQEKIADNMLILTRSLKEQSELANKIIRKDTEVVGRSAELSEKNFLNLKVESEKLQEHSKRACKCWMWIMLVIVLVVFINMVLFMKVMKKK